MEPYMTRRTPTADKAIIPTTDWRRAIRQIIDNNCQLYYGVTQAADNNCSSGMYSDETVTDALASCQAYWTWIAVVHGTQWSGTQFSHSPLRLSLSQEPHMKQTPWCATWNDRSVTTVWMN